MYFRNSELQLQSAVQRALGAEEALQAALGKIQDLERLLQSQSRAEPQTAEGTTEYFFILGKLSSSDTRGTT